MGKTSAREELVRLLSPVASAAGLDLEELEVTPAGKRRVVRVVIDKDGGVSLDDVASISSAVSATLDEPAASAALGGSPYVLEVTSPGVDRPLTETRHWRRAVGRLVRAPRADGGGEVLGRLLEASDDEVVLDVDGEQQRFPRAELGRGRVQVEFSRSGTPPAPDDSRDDDSRDDDSDDDDHDADDDVAHDDEEE
jgi:ribosome maturation factor RimP